MEQVQLVQNKIYEIRGQRVMLDRDLAELYGVETKALNRAVNRNIERFPERFMFQLTKEECLRCQFGTLNESPSKLSRGQHLKYLPYVFTEQGVSMLSAVLRSPIAVRVCIVIMDAYVAMRASLPATSSPSDLAAKLEAFDRRLSMMEQGHQKQLSPAPLPEYLSDEAQLAEYSPKAFAIFTENLEDKRLLQSLGARRNNWLRWNGERCCGWIYPRSCATRLFHHMVPRKEDGWREGFGKSKKNR